MTDLVHTLERTVLVRAPRATVFRYFNDNERWAAWWGAGSTIEPRPGGAVYIRYPNGVEASGVVLEIAEPLRLSYTIGFNSGQPLPPGASRVTIDLAEHPAGTELTLRHDFAEPAVRDHHVQGWRYQLAVFANVVADGHFAGASAIADDWFAAWSEPDGALREALLAEIASPGVRFRDRYSNIDGLEDLKPHLAAVHVFMPGSRLERRGEIRHCQGTLLADWTASGAGGSEGRGTNVFTLGPDGRILEVIGLWQPSSA